MHQTQDGELGSYHIVDKFHIHTYVTTHVSGRMSCIAFVGHHCICYSQCTIIQSTYFAGGIIKYVHCQAYVHFAVGKQLKWL